MLGRWKVRACSRGAVELKWAAGPLVWLLFALWILVIAGAVAWMVAIMGGGVSMALLWPLILIMIATALAVVPLVAAAKHLWTIGTVSLEDGFAEAEYLGPGKLDDVKVKAAGPAKVEQKPGSDKSAKRRVVVEVAGGETVVLGPWLPPTEASRMAECLNRAYKAQGVTR